MTMKAPVIDLLNRIVCNQTMKIEKSSPDAVGRISFNIDSGGAIELKRVRLFRRARDAPG
jgi:hypothetical protein